MYPTACRLHRLVTLAIALWWPVPLAAQPYSAPPQRSGEQQQAAPRQAAPPRSAPRQQVPSAGVRQAANQQNAAPQQNPGVQQAQEPAGNPQAPFVLNQAQQQLLDQILNHWERQSDRVKTFKCTFSRWEVDETFGPPEHNHTLAKAGGEIKFRAPDNGTYLINWQEDWNSEKQAYVARGEGLEHWVCTGKEIFEFDTKNKQLIVRQLDPAMQGKAIVNGPLPFVFGTKADQLKRRYWMRDITPPEDVNQKIWLEAWPKFQQDKANFDHAIVVLNQRDFMPTALRIILPDGKNKQDYVFDSRKVNDPLAILAGDFLPPIKPLGWQKIVIPPGGNKQMAPPEEQPAQARQPAAAMPRK